MAMSFLFNNFLNRASIYLSKTATVLVKNFYNKFDELFSVVKEKSHFDMQRIENIIFYKEKVWKEW